MKNNEKKEKTLDIIIFQILLFIVLIFILIYVFVPKYRKSVNKDLTKIFNTNFDEKTKFLDELNGKEKDKEKKSKESKNSKSSNNEENLKKQDQKEDKKENKEEKTNESTEISSENEEVVVEKTDEEKALELVNQKHNSSGAFMSYIMDKKPGKIYIVGLSDPKTTNLKGMFEVNLNTKTVKEAD